MAGAKRENLVLTAITIISIDLMDNSTFPQISRIFLITASRQ